MVLVDALVVSASLLCIALELGVPGEIGQTVCLAPLVNGA